MTLFIPPGLQDTKRWPGLRIGILGGSFNPPHAGHIHISEVALKTLKLDCVWWLVSPGNPLKKPTDPLPYNERLEKCRALISNPRFIVSDLERRMGTIRSVDTFRILKRKFPGVEFVMIGGMDIAHELPRWYRWRTLFGLSAMAFVARPPEQSLVRNCPVRMRGQTRQRVLARPTGAKLKPGTCFWILQSRLNYQSSTKLRK
jgi:nicotinate-nucleotide adenylyltransferase